MTKSSIASILLTGLALLKFTSFASAGDVSRSWTLFHSFNGGQDFVRRGEVEWDQENEELSVKNDEACLSMANLDQAKETGWYQVKLVLSDENFVLATVPACHIQRANFRDEFQLMIGRDDSVISMGYHPLISPLAPKDCSEMEVEANDNGFSFTSKAAVELDKPGMTIRPVLPNTKPPPGLTFLQNPNARSPDGGPASPNDPPPANDPFSLMKRYWYVLLPLFLANFMGGEAPAEDQEGGTAGGGEAAPAAAASAPSAPRPRRGKKG